MIRALFASLVVILGLAAGLRLFRGIHRGHQNQQALVLNVSASRVQVKSASPACNWMMPDRPDTVEMFDKRHA